MGGCNPPPTPRGYATGPPLLLSLMRDVIQRQDGSGLVLYHQEI